MFAGLLYCAGRGHKLHNCRRAGLPHSLVLPGNAVLNSRQDIEIEYLVGKAG